MVCFTLGFQIANFINGNPLAIRFRTSVNRRNTQRSKAILKQYHLIARPGQSRIESTYLHGLTGYILTQIYSLLRLCPSCDTRKFLRKQRIQQSGLSAAPGAGNHQMLFTAFQERIPNTTCCLLLCRHLGNSHSVAATPFLPLSDYFHRRLFLRWNG